MVIYCTCILKGAIDVSIGNMYKEERSFTGEVYVVGFVPNYLLPKKRPCALDPFLHPLISEVEEIFINGKMIPFNTITKGLGHTGVTTLLQKKVRFTSFFFLFPYNFAVSSLSLLHSKVVYCVRTAMIFLQLIWIMKLSIRDVKSNQTELLNSSLYANKNPFC